MWNKPNHKPKNRSIIAVMVGHWKEHLPMSYEIHFGEVEYSNDGKHWRANSNDMTGLGSWCPGSDDDMIAWCYWDEIKFPEWAKHNTHWGQVKTNVKE